MTGTAQGSDNTSSSVVNTRRLHITPLTKDLLPKILGAQLPSAQAVSFHRILVSPNRDYGFVTLPSTEAAMVKKRLHGTILRGQKVAVEDARVDTRKNKVESEVHQDAEAIPVQPQARTLRKRSREDGLVFEGVELPQGRQVKRGWTESKAELETRKIRGKKEDKGPKRGKQEKKPKRKASSFTDEAECLFKAEMPEDTKGQIKGKEGDRDRKKSKKGKNAVVIHEFENTTKYPGYLRYAADNGKKAVKEYDEDRGWIDEDGKVVEAASESTNKRKSNRLARQEIQQVSNKAPVEKVQKDDETSSSGSSSESVESGESDDEPDAEATETDMDVKNSTRAPEPALSITPSSPVTPHPLETLFKKPKPPLGQQSTKSNLEIDTSFTFFGADEAGQDTGRPQIAKSLETPGLPAIRRRGLPSLSIPVTPYSQRDMQFRSQRSAAPTPDTAAPGKGGFGDPFGLLAGIHKEKGQAIEEDIEEEEDGDVMQGVEEEDRTSSTPPLQSDAKLAGKESDFAKWFWENRGANTRAWKKRKREATKEQKSRESRKRRV